MQSSSPIGTQPLVNPTEAWWAGLSPRDDQSAVRLLHAEIAGGRHQRSVYELFSEMEEKDGHLYSALQTRLNGLLSFDRRVVPARPADENARRAVLMVEQVIERFPRFEEFLRALLDGIAKGFAVVELVWDYDSAGRLVVADWIAHPQEYFAFSSSGALLLLSPPFRAPEVEGEQAEYVLTSGRNLHASRRAFAPPHRKFIALRFGADFRHPYGRGLCQHAYWLYWFKKNAVKAWAVYNEKFGSPAPIATYGPGTSEDDRRRLREILDGLHTGAGMVVPESIQLRFLEQAGSGNGDCFRHFIDWCNDEMSRIVLGATLTTSEGRRSGSLALGNIHQLVRQDYIDADARLLERTLDETLLRWTCELNRGAALTPPHLRIETESPGDLNERVKVDQALLSIGVPLPLTYFYEQYGRPVPQPGDQLLRYDDANFYGYHLQYGVLTVNEVRERLHLPPVGWGSRPTSDPPRRPEGALEPAEDRGHRPQ